MQVYRGMDIGTAKPTVEQQLRVPHYMIDIADPSDPYTVAEFQARARRHLREHEGRVIIAGGSGLHMRAVVDPLVFPPQDTEMRAKIDAMSLDDMTAELLAGDPSAADVVDLNNPRRVQRALEILRLTGETPSERARHADAVDVANYKSHIPFSGFGIDPGEGLAQRVADRVDAMLEAGLVAEVSSLELGRTAGQAVGYKEMAPVISGEWSTEEARAELTRSTMALAKRQRTFFRRDPRISWLDWHDSSEIRYATLRSEVDKVLT